MSLNTKYQSKFDPTRENVGKIARDAAMSHDGHPIEVGEMKGAMIPDLINDINEALNIKCDKPFYLLITEKKDLQIKNAIARTLKHLSYRPWPEDNTTVFWKNPKTQELCFCWDIPHWSEIDNILQNPLFWDQNLVRDCIAWKSLDMEHFGFYKHKNLKWIPNPNHKDRRIETFQNNSSSSI